MGFPFPHGVTSYLSGGVLFIGLGLMIMCLPLGVKAGASSVLSPTLTYVTPLTAERSSGDWPLLFALTMVLGTWLYAATHQAFFVTAVGWWRLALGGLLVEFGTRLSSGCTSGHGLCGVASFSRASLLAVAVFMEVAIVTARIVLLMGVTPMKRLIAILQGGGLFGYGLALSGMARPEVVLSFLELRDLGLLLVMAAALASLGIGNGPVLIGLAGIFVGAYLQGVQPVEGAAFQGVRVDGANQLGFEH
ncbi:YeeE/YedE family protein [Cyanobium gracile]|uniref:YeeE/YedE thiosulfate transporter family protein n=1 Tax=Cyanobium gracile UHCC 0281 TaxID=3110309 RepID=A0ABU5SYG6_9CYAN|nr:YeeE/YedE thiosulfate transporter family protein [Cyanobium gracile]MEA5443559.1 YeeE/YedE thiosulfate transporter family protein [Cyanobium gracile UHCC 0281]